jgi:hypothetical protein
LTREGLADASASPKAHRRDPQVSPAIAAASGDTAPVDDAADFGRRVWVGTVEDRVELVLLGRGGVTGQLAL